MARKRGTEVHYLVLPDGDAAAASVNQLGPSTRSYRIPAPARWYVEIWTSDGSRDRARVDELAEIARTFGGHYDGGERVGGEVWGPDGS